MPHAAASLRRRIARLALRSLISALALASAPQVQAQSPDKASAAHAGIIKVVQGEVEVQHLDQKSPGSVGLRLYPGDRVLTGANGSAGITLRDDTLMSLGPKSSFVLEGFDFNESSGEGNIAVRLAKGSLRYVSGLIGKHAPQRQQLATPTATIGIRGTDFIVEVADE